MPSTPLKAQFRGTVTIEEVDRRTGLILRRRSWRNNVQQNLRSALAAALAGESTFIPAKVFLLRNLNQQNAEYDLTKIDTDAELGASGQTQLAQEVDVLDTAYPVSAILLPLKRVGSSAGTLTVEIRGNASALPDMTDLIATSESVAINTLPLSGYEWVKFPFTTDVTLTGSPIHIVLKSSGYTYSSGVTEVNWGIDTSSPTTTYGDFEKYNGTTWSAYSPTATAQFRVIRRTGNEVSSVLASGNNYILEKTIASKTRQSSVLVRYLAQFSAAEALDYISGVALTDDGTALGEYVVFAFANIDYDKTDTTVDLNVYWTLEVMAVFT